jgi:deoxyribose-phosphate aldolase
MDRTELLSHVDHTLLRPDATWTEIQQLCDEALKYHTASVCVPPSYVSRCAHYLHGRIPVCTVIGFPNGYNTTNAKAFEAAEAADNGADELDVVINLGWVKDQQWGLVMNEIQTVKRACPGKVVKVIIETCLLTEEEKLRLCKTVTLGKLDYIKTSTGFSTGGATREDVELLVKNVGGNVKVKASGGIATLEDAEAFLALGADRLGASKVVKLIMEEEKS